MHDFERDRKALTACPSPSLDLSCLKGHFYLALDLVGAIRCGAGRAWHSLLHALCFSFASLFERDVR